MILFAISGNAWAWGDEGHEIVCEVAMRLAKPSTRAEVQKLIATDQQFASFIDACTFPDHPRTRADDHFVNLPRDASGLTSEDCPGESTCVVTAIPKDLAILSSKSASQAERYAALKYLGHWLGDIHQPLHVSFKDDRGGNSIRVTGDCQSNLHSAWDTCLVVAAVGSDVDAAAAELLKSITPAKIEEWSRSEHPKDWANESFALAESARTKYCIKQGASCELPDPARVKIDTAYIQANTPVVREQLQKAGFRLAHLLDEALGR